MAGIDYYHCAKCGVKMLYIHSEEAECNEMYCARCFNQLEAILQSIQANTFVVSCEDAEAIEALKLMP